MTQQNSSCHYRLDNLSRKVIRHLVNNFGVAYVYYPGGL